VGVDGSVSCCTTYVDCTGVCDGPSVVDLCGVCNGNDFNGITCFDPADIVIENSGHTGTGLQDIYPVYDLTAVNGLMRNFSINVTNDSEFEVVVSFSQDTTTGPNGFVYSPVLLLPQRDTFLPINGTATFEFSTSMAFIVASNRSSWKVRKISVKFFRAAYTSRVYTYDFEVFPSMVHCDSVSEMDRCTRLPACIYCFTNPYMRLLRAASADTREDQEDQEEEGNEIATGENMQGKLIWGMRLSGEYGESSSSDRSEIDSRYGDGSGSGRRTPSLSMGSRRRLFSNQIPKTETDRGSTNTDGVCGDGWSTRNCRRIAPYDYVSAAAVPAFAHSSYGHVLLTLTLITSSYLFLNA
jgi:hypothetical protein